MTPAIAPDVNWSARPRLAFNAFSTSHESRIAPTNERKSCETRDTRASQSAFYHLSNRRRDVEPPSVMTRFHLRGHPPAAEVAGSRF